MSGQVIDGVLAGATFRFECDAPDLMAYAGHHLAPLAGRDVGTPLIRTVLRWHDGQPPQQRPASGHMRMDRVDRDVYVSGDTLWWFRVDDLRDLHLRFTWTENGLMVGGDFYHRLGNDWRRDYLRRALFWRQGRALRERRFTTLLYYLVYYPCWWWLEHVRDLHPIHAAGVSTDAGVILLAGASGVAKSTLAVALAIQPRARLLSDSFVVHNGTEVLAVREPVLLDAWSRRWLGECGAALQAIDGRYLLNRRGYTLPAEQWVDGGRAAMLVLPRRSMETYTKRLSPEQAHQRLSAADLIVNDLRRYWAFAAILEQLAPGTLMARREAQIARLVAEVPCYELGLAAETSCTDALQSIMRLLPDTPLRVVSSRL
jgi:hypothetical protein